MRAEQGSVILSTNTKEFLTNKRFERSETKIKIASNAERTERHRTTKCVCVLVLVIAFSISLECTPLLDTPFHDALTGSTAGRLAVKLFSWPGMAAKAQPTNTPKPRHSSLRCCFSCFYFIYCFFFRIFSSQITIYILVSRSL